MVIKCWWWPAAVLPDHHQHLILSKRFTQSFSTFFTPRPSLSITIFQSRPLFNLHSFFFLNSFFLPPGNIPHEQLQNMCYNLIFLCYHPTTSYSILFIFYFIYSTSVQNVFFNFSSIFLQKLVYLYIHVCILFSSYFLLYPRCCSVYCDPKTNSLCTNILINKALSDFWNILQLDKNKAFFPQRYVNSILTTFAGLLKLSHLLQRMVSSSEESSNNKQLNCFLHFFSLSLIFLWMCLTF